MSTSNHPRPCPWACARVALPAVLLSASLAGCDSAPHTTVILDNTYPTSAADPLVVYQAYWQAVPFTGPVDPGQSSSPQTAEPTSGDTAYVVLAPGWDPDASATPTSFVVLQSRSAFSVGFNGTLHIPVDDSTFTGNCATSHPLTQSQADFITQIVFPCAFASLTYDAATCTVTPRADDAGVTCDTGLP